LIFAEMKKILKWLFPYLGVSATILLGATTIMGGLFAWGVPVGIAVLLLTPLLSIFIVAAGKHLSSEYASLPNDLKLTAFSYPPAPWLLNRDSELLDLLKGALVLLVFDRTESGLWSKTYLYRRTVANVVVPKSRGTLTGTPLALIAIASSIQTDDSSFLDWAYTPLEKTLTKNLRKNGEYIQTFTVSTFEERKAVWEPPRHAAGGVLAKMLFKNPGPYDIETLKNLCSSHHQGMGWTQAVIVRALLHATYLKVVPRTLRRKAKRLFRSVLADMLESAESSLDIKHIWADPLQHTSATKNQWMSLWAILPALTVPRVPNELQSRFRQLLYSFLKAQDASVSEKSLLPTSFDEQDRSLGAHVFGTAIALTAWRTLAVKSPIKDPDDDKFARKTCERLLAQGTKLLESPAEHPKGESKELEGYFAWAGICLAAASVGIRVSSVDFRNILKLVETLSKSNMTLSMKKLTQTYQQVIKQASLVSPEVACSVAKSVSRIKQYYKEVPPPQS